MRLYYDLHIHSCLSPCGDADMTPNNIVGMARLKGLDVIAVADHNTADNVQAVIDAAKDTEVLVIPAIEAESAEEVHVLCLFSDAETAVAFGRRLREGMVIPNQPEFFGHQIKMDEFDEVVGEEEMLLLSASDMTVEEIDKEVERLGGVAIPAHLDRDSYSLVSNLGFIPPDLSVETVELSKKADYMSFMTLHPEFINYRTITNSDAHYLGDIAEKEHYLEVSDRNIETILKKLSKK